LVNIPTVEQMRNILDGIAAKHLFPLFKWIYQGLGDQGYLRLFAALDGNLLVTLDGTQYWWTLSTGSASTRDSLGLFSRCCLSDQVSVVWRLATPSRLYARWCHP